MLPLTCKFTKKKKNRLAWHLRCFLLQGTQSCLRDSVLPAGLNLPLICVWSSGELEGSLGSVSWRAVQGWGVGRAFPGESAHCVPLTWRPGSHPPGDREGGCSWWNAKWPGSQRKRLRLLENNAQGPPARTTGPCYASWLRLKDSWDFQSFQKDTMVFVLFMLGKAQARTHTRAHTCTQDTKITPTKRTAVPF